MQILETRRRKSEYIWHYNHMEKDGRAFKPYLFMGYQNVVPVLEATASEWNTHQIQHITMADLSGTVGRLTVK